MFVYISVSLLLYFETGFVKTILISGGILMRREQKRWRSMKVHAQTRAQTTRIIIPRSRHMQGRLVALSSIISHTLLFPRNLIVLMIIAATQKA